MDKPNLQVIDMYVSLLAHEKKELILILGRIEENARMLMTAAEEARNSMKD